MPKHHNYTYRTIGHHPTENVLGVAFPGNFGSVLQDRACTWAWIPLYKFGKVVAYAKVDKADLPLVGNVRWGLIATKRCSYAYRSEHIPGTASGTVAIYMHRLILGLTTGMGGVRGVHADHINHEGLDNRRANLRIVTQTENLQNRRMFTNNKSGHMGVSYVPPRPANNRRATTTGYWHADLKRNGVYIHRSRHPTKEAAIAARLKAEADYAARSEGLAS